MSNMQRLAEHDARKFVHLMNSLIDTSCDFFLFEDLPSAKVYLLDMNCMPFDFQVYLCKSVNDAQSFMEKSVSDIKSTTGIDKTIRVSYAYNNKTEGLAV